MSSLKLYNVDPNYVDYLTPHFKHMYHNKQAGQQNERKYVGIVLIINGMEYFAPLSSFKDKHRRMTEGLDFLKIHHYAVINLNCMFPVPKGHYTYVNIKKERNPHYKELLESEYRYIKSIQDKIKRNADNLYKKMQSGEVSTLTKRCNDFILLEELCKKYR